MSWLCNGLAGMIQVVFINAHIVHFTLLGPHFSLSSAGCQIMLFSSSCLNHLIQMYVYNQNQFPDEGQHNVKF